MREGPAVICAVHQPQYLPWLGYFSKLDAADVFVIYDDTQYKHDEWQNRNRIKTPHGVQWLTVPVHHSQGELVRDIRIDNLKPWPRKHANALTTNYGRSPFCEQYAGGLAAVYTMEWERLAELSITLIELVCSHLGIDTPMVRSSELGYDGRSTDALISICKAVGADTYLSGPGGHDYLETERFEAEGISLTFHDFEHPVYEQTYGEFEPYLSAIDLLFNRGPESLSIIRDARSTSPYQLAEPQEVQ